MIDKRQSLQITKDPAMVKAPYRPLVGAILRGMVLLVALCSFVPVLADFTNGRAWGASLPIFFLASVGVIGIMLWPGTASSIEGKGAIKQLRLFDWWLLSYFITISLGLNWACSFLWLSRRDAFFSGPVIAVTALITASYAGIALLVALLTRRNWRTGLLVFAFAPGVLAIIVLRLGLLR